jgi:hypothetical protein
MDRLGGGMSTAVTPFLLSLYVGMEHPGCSQHSLAEETSAEVADAMLRLNTLAPIALTRAALPVTALRVTVLPLPSRHHMSFYSGCDAA